MGNRRYRTIGFALAALVLAGCEGGSGSSPASEAVAEPTAPASPGAQRDESDGDALVAGTGFNATGTVRCVTREGEAEGDCRAGVVRNRDGTAVLTVSWPDGRSRALFFDASQRATGADTNEADGSAAYKVVGERDNDMLMVTIGPERYEIPEVLIAGD